MSRLVIKFTESSEVEKREAKNSDFVWGQQKGVATEYDDSSNVIQLRPVVIPVPCEIVNGKEVFAKHDAGEYLAPFGSTINGFGNLEMPMMTPLQKIKKGGTEPK